MQKYVFEFVFPSMEAFFGLKLQMRQKEQDLVAKILKLMFMAVPYKTKPVHDKNIQSFVRTIRTIQQLKDLGGDVSP
jgi:hypothetical protein